MRDEKTNVENNEEGTRDAAKFNDDAKDAGEGC